MAGAVLVAVLDVFTEVLSLIGMYAPGEPIAAADSASLLFTLNGIVDGYGAEPLTIFAHQIYTTFLTAPGKQSYTLGPASVTPVPDFAITPLPAEITGVGFVLSPSLEVPVELITRDAWAAIGLKSLQSSYLQSCWIDFGAPTYTLNFWPLPSAAIPLVIYADQAVPRFTAISNTFLLPAGYLELITYELVIKSAPKFGAQIPEWIPTAWSMAKSRVKEANFEPLDMRCDAGITQQNRVTGGGSIRFYEGK